MHNHMRLDDLLSRDVRIQWFEGVALIQSVCRHILEGSASGHHFPEPSDIGLGPDGSVFVLGRSKTGGIAGAGHLLARMLTDDVPVRLRLVITQATGTESGYASLGEFCEALAYFERPDGPQILRQLHERAVLAPPGQGARGQLERPPVNEQPVASAPHPAPKRVGRTAAMAVTGAAVLFVTIWLVGTGAGDTRIYAALDRLRASFTPAENAPPDEPVAATTGSTQARTVKPAGVARASEPPRPRETERTAAESATGAPRALNPFVWLPEMPRLPRPASRPADYTARFIAPGASIPIFTDREPIVVIASAAREERASDVEGRVFSKADAGVAPPRSIYPKLPPEPATVPRPDMRTVLELLIATDGLVERVRLMTPPRDVHEFMLVSAAKAWRFEPAIFEGRPVRFLHRVTIPTVP